MSKAPRQTQTNSGLALRMPGTPALSHPDWPQHCGVGMVRRLSIVGAVAYMECGRKCGFTLEMTTRQIFGPDAKPVWADPFLDYMGRPR